MHFEGRAGILGIQLDGTKRLHQISGIASEQRLARLGLPLDDSEEDCNSVQLGEEESNLSYNKLISTF